MNTPFPFDGMLVFAFLSALLLAGVVLRAKISLLQRFLVPSCLIGGVLGFMVVSLDLFSLNLSMVESLAYHFFNISFISVGLTREEEAEGRPSRQLVRGAAWMALIQGLTFPLQAILGGLAVVLFGLAGVKLFPTFGFLVPLGFNEGPGQALSIGKVWETVGFSNAATIGLAFAAAGYFCAFFVGVPLVNRGIRSGRAAFGPSQLPPDLLKGILPPTGQETAGALTIHSGNAETLAFQTALVGLVYGGTYLIVSLLVRSLTAFGIMGPNDAKILWGFFFFFGLGAALVTRKILGRIGAAHLVDPGIQRRITGWSVDYLIVATVVAIQLTVLWKYALPIGLICLINAVATTGLVVWFGRRLDAFQLERTAAIYGVVTGTVSCGLLLLRIADPEFRTPAAFEIAVMNVFALPVVGGCTVLVNGPLWWGWSVMGTMAVFAGVMAVVIVLMYWMKFIGKKV